MNATPQKVGRVTNGNQKSVEVLANYFIIGNIRKEQNKCALKTCKIKHVNSNVVLHGNDIFIFSVNKANIGYAFTQNR